jgi:RNA polymerase sigma-70 factor (ECF subfamily)
MATETGVLDDALARASRGDEAGFLELWRALQPRLLRFLRVVGCDDPDDVASETWLQVVRDLHRFSGGEEDFRRWLFTIGRHRAVDAARARSRRPAGAVNSGLDLLADTQLVEDQVLDGMSVQGALALLSGLSRRSSGSRPARSGSPCIEG